MGFSRLRSSFAVASLSGRRLRGLAWHGTFSLNFSLHRSQNLSIVRHESNAGSKAKEVHLKEVRLDENHGHLISRDFESPIQPVVLHVIVT